MKETIRKYWDSALLALFIGINSIYIWLNGRDLLNSDVAAELMLAKQLNTEGKLLSRNWFYSSELRVLNTQLIYKPAFALFPNDWHKARTLSVLLFLLVGAAVALFVINGTRMDRYEYLEKEPIDTAYGIAGMVTERRERYKDTYIRFLVSGIVLIVLSVIPLFVSMILFGEAEYPGAIAVCILLVMVAIGVFFIVRVNVVWDAYHILLEEGEYTRAEKESKKKIGPVSAVYWLTVVAAFLAYSFYTNHWERSWIIWPVAGVVYGIVYIIAKSLQRKG